MLLGRAVLGHPTRWPEMGPRTCFFCIEIVYRRVVRKVTDFERSGGPSSSPVAPPGGRAFGGHPTRWPKTSAARSDGCDGSSGGGPARSDGCDGSSGGSTARSDGSSGPARSGSGSPEWRRGPERRLRRQQRRRLTGQRRQRQPGGVNLIRGSQRQRRRLKQTQQNTLFYLFIYLNRIFTCNRTCLSQTGAKPR